MLKRKAKIKTEKIPHSKTARQRKIGKRYLNLKAQGKHTEGKNTSIQKRTAKIKREKIPQSKSPMQRKIGKRYLNVKAQGKEKEGKDTSI